jgi:hypothetical protein
MKKKLESEKYYRWYATVIVKDLIENSRVQSLVEYILLTWKHYPQLMKRELLNAKTIQYLNNKGKNEKTNIVKFRNKPTLN